MRNGTKQRKSPKPAGRQDGAEPSGTTQPGTNRTHTVSEREPVPGLLIVLLPTQPGTNRTHSVAEREPVPGLLIVLLPTHRAYASDACLPSVQMTLMI